VPRFYFISFGKKGVAARPRFTRAAFKHFQGQWPPFFLSGFSETPCSAKKFFDRAQHSVSCTPPVIWQHGLTLEIAQQIQRAACTATRFFHQPRAGGRGAAFSFGSAIEWGWQCL
jgi:hypothetical protein